MSDPLFLRNMMSSSVYAEQMNSAQIQGAAAARERAIRARQEALKDEQAQITGLQESSKSGIQDRERQQGGAEAEAQERSESDSAEDGDMDDTTSNEGGGNRHIDLTV